MKNLFITFILFALGFTSNAQLNTQSLVSTAGDYFETETITMSWSLGEIATETFIGDNITLTQGFQQSKLTIIGIDESKIDQEIDIAIYPNPSNGIVNLVIDNTLMNSNSLPNRYIIYDIQGKLLSNEPILENRTVVDLQLFMGSIFYLKVLNTKTLWFQTFVIQKQNN